ncbi:MAG: hypothetical protein M1834_009611 [Cirrosporium novae-zelandiae]|nr:MAG: hypothetical protein M1834_009611 [Cirrosporium novae-zelandiae]
MGSAESKPDPQVARQLAERLRALDLKESEKELEKGYIYVEGDEPPAYSAPSQVVSINQAEQWEKELLEDPKNRLALSALSSHNVKDVLTRRSTTISDTQTFNIKIPFEGAPITNQNSSGRCWLFASTNVFRVAIMKKHNLNEFELSQAYLFFWDKLEKANYFLENVLDTVKEPLDGRLVKELMKDPVGDGGQWDMVANLVEKYGLVPQSLYPDSFNAKSSRIMGSLITTKLREDCLTLRSLASKKNSISTVASAKDKMLREIHLMLTLMLGPPPNPNQKFTWEYDDKDGKFRKIVTTPRAFSKELSSSDSIRANAGTDVNKLFSLVNDPRNSYMSLLTVERLGNVFGGRPITYVNVDMTTMKKACIDMLQAGIPVFFGSDVGKYSNSVTGIMDTGLIDYELGFNISLGMSKAQRLMTGESSMTHAMVLTAVHVVDGKPVRWRVMNSWGDKAGSKGYFVMSDKWMDEFVYQAVVDPSFVGKEVKDVLGQQPTVLPLWDPMGALA